MLKGIKEEIRVISKAEEKYQKILIGTYMKICIKYETFQVFCIKL